MIDGPIFPVLAVGPDRYTGDATNERFYLFREAASLGKATRVEQRAGARPKWDLIDNRGRAFRIVREVRQRPRTPFWRQALLTLLGQRDEIEDNLEIEFSPPSNDRFEGAKARVWASIIANPNEWLEDGAAVDDDSAASLRATLNEARVALDAAADVADLFNRLDAAWLASDAASSKRRTP